MSETAAITKAAIVGEQSERKPVHLRSFVVAGVVVALGAGIVAWFARDGGSSLSTAVPGVLGRVGDPGLQHQFDSFAWRVIVVACVLAGGLVAAIITAWKRWHRNWLRHWQEQERQWRSKLAGLEFQLAERHRRQFFLEESEARMKTQVAELSQQKALLQSELDQRKQIERSFSKERQVLESSKTVLELHVQASSQELQNLKHRYEMILNSAGEGICGLDLEGRVTFVNPAVKHFTGWALEEVIGKKEEEIFLQQNGDSPADNSGGNVGERIFCRKDGTRFPVEYIRTPIEEHGQQTGSVLIFKDVTERRRAEEALAQKAAELSRSNAELEQFAFVASHDLQEPLRKIQAFGDRLKLKCNGLLPQEALDYLRRMQNASARMRTLIDDLLAFSRVIRSSDPFVPVNLTQITREVLGDLEVLLEKSGGKAEIGELPMVEADPTQMRQLLLNLIGNALKFQAPGSQPLVNVQGRVITSASGEELCELTVQDNGIGFEEQYAEKIFAVFQRLHGREEYEGTGVGLAVCRRITDRHQGTVIARSQLGKGSAFIVTLPLRQSQRALAT